MASTQTPRDITCAMLSGRKPSRTSASVLIGTYHFADADCPAVFSYGPHFPMAVKMRHGVLVNTDKYSTTTSIHQSGAREALRQNGYRPTDRTIEHNGHTFAIWTA